MYLQTFVDLLSSGGENKDEASNRIVSLCLLTCYNQMEFFKADDILRKYKDYKKIPALEDEYKELIGLDKWYDIFSGNDKERLDAEMQMLQEAAAELKSEELEYDDSRREQESAGENNEQYDEQDIYVNREKKVELDIFGLNVTKLDNLTKNILGISLIFLVFFAVIYGLKWIKDLRKKDVKKKDKKKKQ